MIDNIKLAAVFAMNDNSNILSNVMVKNGKVTAQNGITGISLSCDSDIEFCCNAKRLIKSLNNCNPENVKLSLKNDKLFLSSGRFKSNIPVISADSYPETKNTSQEIDIPGDIINSMNGIVQFSDPNDVRIALRGVEISDGSLNATNGHMAIKKYIDCIDGFESVVIPSKSIQAMAKVNAHIDTIATNGKIVFFSFNDGYLFSKTIDQKMPDLNKVLSDIEQKTEFSIMSDAIKTINSMCDDDRTVIIGKKLETRSGESYVDGFDLKDCAFNSDYLIKIMDVAECIDFSKYPGPCPFEGDNVRGAVVGVVL